jgi:hypothetical protein
MFSLLPALRHYHMILSIQEVGKSFSSIASLLTLHYKMIMEE